MLMLGRAAAQPGKVLVKIIQSLCDASELGAKLRAWAYWYWSPEYRSPASAFYRGAVTAPENGRLEISENS